MRVDPQRLFEGARARYRHGLGHSTRENSGAFAFSIMITATFGAVVTLAHHVGIGEVFLFASGAVVGFVAVASLGTVLADPEEDEPQRATTLVIASGLSIFSVLVALGAATLVGWLGNGWYVWLFAPMAAVAVFLLANGLEYALAQEQEENG